MRIDLHTHSRASDGTAHARRSWCARPRPPGSTCSALTDHDTADGWAEAAAEPPRRSASRWCRGMEISTRHRGPRRAPARLPARPDLPAAGRRARADPRRPRRRGCRRCSTRLRDLGIDITVDDVRAGRGRRRGDRPPARRRRAGHPRRRPRPDRGVRPLPGRGPAGATSTGTPRRWTTTIRAVAGGRRGVGDRAPVGPRRPGALPDEATRRARAGSGWPASRSTTRTTTRRPASGSARSPATSAWSSPAPATTTAPARPTTTSAATPRHPRSTSGCSTLAAARGARSRAWSTPGCTGLSYFRPSDWNRWSTPARDQPRGGRDHLVLRRSGSRTTLPLA